LYVIRPRAQVFEIMFMVAAVLGGVAILIAGPHLGTAVSRTIPPWLTMVLGGGLFLGGATVLVGLLTRHVVRQRLLERAGLAALGLLMFSYAGFTFYASGLRGLITAEFFLSFSLGCAWRIWQIGLELRDFEEASTPTGAPQDQKGGTT